MVHSMRPARTSLSDYRRESKNETYIRVQGRRGNIIEVNQTICDCCPVRLQERV